MRWFLASIALFAVSVGAAPPSASPDERSLLQQQIAPQIGTAHIPGAVAGVMRGGDVTLEAFGASDQRGTPMMQDARFAIGSLTKQFTAVAVLMLAQERRLSLADRLARYFPALPNAKTITIRMLLNQTSGLHNYPKTTEHTWPLYGTIDPARLFAILAQDKPDFAPGTKWEYSNTNYTVLAGIVAMAGGVPYGEFLQQRIFGPLGMTSSGYGAGSQHDLVQATWQGHWVPPGQALSLDLYYGAGGIVSTARDMLRWDTALMHGTLLNAHSMHELWTAGALNDGSPVQYAMGFVPATLDGHREVWHNGLVPSAGGFGYNAIFPNDGFAVVLLTNDGDVELNGFAESLVRTVFEANYGAAAAAGEDPAVTAVVRSLLEQFRTGNLDPTQFQAQFNDALTPALLQTTRPFFQSLGNVTSLTFTGSRPVRHSTIYSYRGAFSNGSTHDIELCLYNNLVCGFRVIP